MAWIFHPAWRGDFFMARIVTMRLGRYRPPDPMEFN